MHNISIITICFNNLPDLQRACASVDAQTVLPDEHWVINGSTNNEIEQWLLRTPQPPHRRWVNERDNGISDAFNKGIHKAGSEITHLLNSGDQYASNDVLERVMEVFANNSSIQWISGNIQMTRAGKSVIVGKPFEKNKLYRGMRSVSHPTWFVKKEVYSRVGLFSSKYKMAMDYDLLCRLGNEPYAYLDKTMVIFDDTGVSSNNYIASLQENRKVYESHFGFSVWLIIWQLRLKLLHYLLQTSFGKRLFKLKKKAGLENM
ncbi:MAG: glycosyltransferase [Bacteroidota bacterium]